MMATGTLARYISLRFLMGIASIFTLCVVLVLLIDLIELLRISGKYGGVSVGKLMWLTALRMPSIVEVTFPFCVLAGTIGAFLMLSRSSELVIMRAAGISVWQFVFPGLLVAGLFGAFATALYNPIAASAKAEADRVYARAFGKSQSLMQTKAGSWLAQDGVDGKSIINAKHSANQGMQLTGVTIFQYDKTGALAERIDAEKANLLDGRWQLTNVNISIKGRQTVKYDTYLLSTYLTPTEVRDAMGSVESISFWDLPKIINVAEKAGLSASRYKLQYQELLSTPLLLITMVLLGATCSLRPFRFGKIQTMIIGGLVAGFAFFLFTEVSKNLGANGILSPQIATWVPVSVVCLLSVTVLLHQEDG